MPTLLRDRGTLHLRRPVHTFVKCHGTDSVRCPAGASGGVLDPRSGRNASTDVPAETPHRSRPAGSPRGCTVHPRRRNLRGGQGAQRRPRDLPPCRSGNRCQAGRHSVGPRGSGRRLTVVAPSNASSSYEVDTLVLVDPAGEARAFQRPWPVHRQDHARRAGRHVAWFALTDDFMGT